MSLDKNTKKGYSNGNSHAKYVFFGTRTKPKNLNMEAGNTQHQHLNCQCIGISLTWRELI